MTAFLAQLGKLGALLSPMPASSANLVRVPATSPARSDALRRHQRRLRTILAVSPQPREDERS